MEEFLQHVARLTTLTPALATELERRVQVRQLARHELLHRAGQLCLHTHWVVSGLLRSFFYKNGRDVTDGLAAEYEWLTAYSFLSGQPDQTHLQAVEDTQLIRLSQPDLAYLFEQFPAMERFGRITLASQLVRQSERLALLQVGSAAERYAQFEQAHRALLPRLPLGMVASYLGIAQETLSRVRASRA